MKKKDSTNISRNDELQEQLKDELVKFGITNVNFHSIDKYNWKINYKTNDFLSQRDCLRLKKNIETTIRLNLPIVSEIIWSDKPDIHKIYSLSLSSGNNYIINDKSTTHGLLSLAYEQIFNFSKIK